MQCPPPSAHLLHQGSSPAPLCGEEAVSASGKWLQNVPEQQAVFLLFLGNASQQDLVLKLPDMPNMAKKSSQSYRTRQQNMVGLSHQLQQYLPTSTASRWSPVPRALPAAGPALSCSLVCFSAPNRAQSQSTPKSTGCYMVVLLVVMHSSTPISTQKLMKLTRKTSFSRWTLL